MSIELTNIAEKLFSYEEPTDIGRLVNVNILCKTCMKNKLAVAAIPCGHTFCEVCGQAGNIAQVDEILKCMGVTCILIFPIKIFVYEYYTCQSSPFTFNHWCGYYILCMTHTIK